MIGDIVYNTYRGRYIRWDYNHMFYHGRPIEGRDIEPVPLTTEILELNRFESRDNFYEIKFQADEIDNSIFKIAEFENSGNWFFGFCGFPNLIENFRINYVHELQHALRLCGLNDLANNFKIE